MKIIFAALLFLFAMLPDIAVAQVERNGDTVIIKEDMGGSMTTYMVRYSKMRNEHIKLAIDGECDSSCTLFFGYLPHESICITPNAKLGFHRSNRPEGTVVMLMNYPQPILWWLLAEGLTEDVKYLPKELLETIFDTCPDSLINPKPPAGEKVD